MNTNMKHALAAVILFTCAVTAQAGSEMAGIRITEKLCLDTAGMAGTIARHRTTYGNTAEQMTAVYDKLLEEKKDIDASTRASVGAMFHTVIKFVYALQLTETEARRAVYIKCKNGEYS